MAISESPGNATQSGPGCVVAQLIGKEEGWMVGWGKPFLLCCKEPWASWEALWLPTVLGEYWVFPPLAVSRLPSR